MILYEERNIDKYINEFVTTILLCDYILETIEILFVFL